jgi:hypothetical protein
MSNYKEHDDKTGQMLVIACALPIVLMSGMMWLFGSTDEDANTQVITNEKTEICFGHVTRVVMRCNHED